MIHVKESSHPGPVVLAAWDVPHKGPIPAWTNEEENKKLPDNSDNQDPPPAYHPGPLGQDSAMYSGYMKYLQRGSDVSTFRRVFWLMVIMGAMSGLGIQVYRCTDKFIARETNTKLSYVNKDQLDFPSITICNTNMFRLGMLSDIYGGWMPAYCYGLVDLRTLFPQTGISSNDEYQDVGQYSESITDRPFYPGRQDLYEFIVNSAHPIETMIKRCQFNGRTCSADNFTTIITNYGVCYTFNSASNEEKISVKTPGQRQGLSLILNAEEADVVAAPRETVGFKMLVHPRGEIPNLLDYGIELQPGTHTSLRLDVRRSTSLPSPYGECGAKELQYYSGRYTEMKCYFECETDYIVSQCGCRSFYMPGNAEYCSPKQLQCFYEEIIEFAERRNEICSCPEECVEMYFNPTISQMAFPSYGTATTLQMRNDYDLIVAGFAEAVRDKSNGEIQSLYWDTYIDVAWALSEWRNSDNVTFMSFYPNTTWILVDHVMNYVFGNIEYELFTMLSDTVLYDIMADMDNNLHLYYTPSENETVNFWEVFQEFTDKYLHSGRFRQSLVDAFMDSGEYMGSDTEDFDDFIDNVIDYFELTDFFFMGYNDIFRSIRWTVWAKAWDIAENEDILELTTQYMRNNFVHVDIFYGDLKIERIQEQKSYETFQFICDVGGALGLFFGASILSFIETADFWFAKRGICGSGRSKDKTKDNPKVGIDIDDNPKIATLSQ